MATVTVTPENFESTIVDNDIVFLDFWASWCGPCRAFGPVFESASEQHEDIVFAKVNTEEQPQLAAMFGITSIPTLVAFRERVMVYGEAGALPAPDFDHLIGTVKSLDMDEVHRKVAEAQAKADAEKADAEKQAAGT
jgi:thioredoxin 1